MRRRCTCLGDLGRTSTVEIADQIAESLNNAHWARDGLEALGREDLARRLDEVLDVLHELDDELGSMMEDVT